MRRQSPSHPASPCENYPLPSVAAPGDSGGGQGGPGPGVVRRPGPPKEMPVAVPSVCVAVQPPMAEQALAEKPSPVPGLDDICQWSYGNRGQYRAKVTRTAREMLQCSFAPLARIDGSRLRFACLVMLSQVIHDACDLVRGRHDGLLWPKACPHCTKVGTESRVRPCHRLRRLAKGLGGPIDHFQRP